MASIGHRPVSKYLLFSCRKSEFQDIRIEIKKLNGEPLEFQNTDVPVKVVLHFRRI